MKRLFLLSLLLMIIGMAQISYSQSNEPVATLVPPTPIPLTPQPENDALPTTSTIARIQRDGVVRVGILYNEPPFSDYTVRGELAGYDADLARAIAETWGVEIAFVQVTRQNAFDKLANAEVDMLLAAVVHRRDLDSHFEFSQTYRLGHQVIMTQTGSSISTIFNLGGQRVGYVVGTEGEEALRNWSASSGIQIQAQTYLTHDRVLAALFGGEIAAIAGRDSRLLKVASNVLNAVTILDTPIQDEPFAIAMLRQDIHFRNLINRTLQYLLSDAAVGTDSTLETLHSQYFPNDEFAYDALAVYATLGDEAPTPAQFGTDIPFPQFYTAPNIINNAVVRVAGYFDPEGLLPWQATIAQVNRSLVEQMAARWGVRVEYISGDPIQLIESGQADMAVGITPDWNLAPQVDFSQPYVLHGRRILYREGRDDARFGNLRGDIVATIRGDMGAQELAEAWARTVNVALRFFETTDDGAAQTILEDNNADVVFGDSFLLLPQLRANPDDLVLGPVWYDRSYLVFALPRNDLDFRRLVDYTLQELYRDKTLATILVPIVPGNEGVPTMGIGVGSSDYLGLSLSR
jgi:ABC-type amino acid transport substrate-binding protein